MAKSPTKIKKLGMSLLCVFNNSILWIIVVNNLNGEVATEFMFCMFLFI